MICLHDQRWQLEQERDRLRGRLTELRARLSTLGHQTGLTYRELLQLAKEGK